MSVSRAGDGDAVWHCRGDILHCNRILRLGTPPVSGHHTDMVQPALERDIGLERPFVVDHLPAGIVHVKDEPRRMTPHDLS